MNDPFEKIEDSFALELPPEDNLDNLLDQIIPAVRQWGEDLSEMKYYVQPGGKPWLEIRDDPGFQESVLHFFNEGGEYLQVVDGNVNRGRWRLLDQTNKIIIEQGGGGQKQGGGGGGYQDQGGGGGGGNASRNELFELAFLNSKFFILKKHGDQSRKRKRRYMMLGYEPVVTGYEWRDCVELLFNEYRSHWSTFHTMVVIAILVVLVLFLMSYL